MEPATSSELLQGLFANERIALHRGEVFEQTPPAIALDECRRQQRMEGMIVGLAVGDALGHSTEWQYDPDKRRAEFGTIVDHVGSFLSPAGRISDDTQLSLWTLERLLATGSFDVHDLVRCFVERRKRIVGIGRNTSAALERHHERLTTGRLEFHQCAGDPVTEGRGNGALMRFAPLVLPHLRSPSKELWSDITLSTLITHGHPAALSSVLAFAHLLWEILRRPAGDSPPAEWWLDEYVRVASDLETAPLPVPLAAKTGSGVFDRNGPEGASHQRLPTPFSLAGIEPIPAMFRDFRGTLWQFVDSRVRQAWRRRMSLRDACSLSGFGSGADSAQSVPAVLYVLMSHADSFESAVIAAVNDTKDNDTIASIVGAMLGALHGRRAIRRRWITGIQSRSLGPHDGWPSDDRDVIEFLAHEAAARFGD